MVPGLNPENWRIYSLVSAIPIVFALLPIWYLPNTPYFCCSDGRPEEAEIVVNKIIILNEAHPMDPYEAQILKSYVPVE